jgi:putative flippase GtrA
MRAFVNRLAGKDKAAVGQALRFTAVGIAVNLLLYVIYLALTSFGTGHKTAATLVYFGGVALNFFAHKKITFTDQGAAGRQLAPFAVVVGIAYAVNLGGLYLFVDIMKAPHQFVQAAMIVLCAVISFTLQKIWVFRKEK